MGPTTSAWLAEAGLQTRDDLVRVGPIEACRMMRAAGHPASLNAAYAIEAGLMDLHWQALPLAFKQDLALRFRQMTREEGRPVANPAAPRQGHRRSTSSSRQRPRSP